MHLVTHCPQCGEEVVQARTGQKDDYCEECGWPNENRAAADGVKFYLLQHGDGCNEHVLHVFVTSAERDAKTKELIYGDDELSPDDERGLALYLDELRDSGGIEFEGDPGLEWFNAKPAN